MRHIKAGESPEPTFYRMRSFTKSILRAIALLIVAPAVLASWLQGQLIGSTRAFPGWAQLFSLLPGMCGEYLRHAFFRGTTARCDDDVCISFGTVLTHPGVSIGRGSFLGHFCCLGNVAIEDDVLIASRVSVINGCAQHGTERLDIPIRDQPGILEEVTIGEGSWIGEGATIAASVGRHCLVGAGSLVLKPLPDYSIAVGSPAKVIGDRRDKTVHDEEDSVPEESIVLC